MASILSYALTTKADVKESLGIASSDTSKDNLIIRNINKATIAIENYCERRFKETTYTDELYNATQTDQLILKQRPITSLTTFSLSVRDTGLNSDSWNSIDTEQYFVDNASGIVDSLYRNFGNYKRYKVTYSAGYTTIPEDLAEACVDLACYYIQNRGASNVGIVVKREGQREVRYDNKAASFAEILKNLGIDGIINNYANSAMNGR
jgi:hypothetical protein